MSYASTTEVSTARTRAEIEDLLLKYGASRFGFMTHPDRGEVAFEFEEPLIRITVPLPHQDDDEFKWTNHSTRRQRDGQARRKAWEQACRSRWRALLLVIKAKLEAIEVGISTFEHEFLAHIVTGNGRTIGEQIIPQIENAIASGGGIPLLEGPR